MISPAPLPQKAFTPLACGLYKHYKGGLYHVIGVGEHTETQEYMVCYISLDASLPGPRMRFRPLSGKNGFLTEVMLIVDGGLKRVTRFEYQGYSVL